MDLPVKLPPGLHGDDTCFLTGNRWTSGDHVRFVKGQPQTIGPWCKVLSSGAVGMRSMFVWLNASTAQVAYGGSSILKVGVGIAAPTTITPAGLGSGWLGWSFSSWGNHLLAAPFGGRLYYWNGTGVATLVSQAPEKINFMLVTPERQVLAFGCNEEVSGTFNSRCIRGSDIEDMTSWESLPTNNAFEYILDSPSDLMAAEMVGGSVVAWTRGEIYLGQYVGDPSQTYRFDKVDEGCGLVGAQAHCTFHGAAYFVGSDLQLKRYMPGVGVETIPCPIWEEWQQEVGALPDSGAPRLIVRAMEKYGEIWLIHAATGDEPAARYIAYSVYESIAAQRPVWFQGAFARSAMLDSELLVENTYRTSVFMGDLDGNLWAHETTRVGADCGPTSWFIRSADFYMDEGGRRMMIRSTRPDFFYPPAPQGYATEPQHSDVQLMIYVRPYPQGSAIEKGPYILPGDIGKKDLRVSGKLISLKYHGTDTQYVVRLGKPVFDVVPLGER